MKILGKSSQTLLVTIPILFLFAASALAASYGPAKAVSAAPHMGVVIPLYTYPTDGTWAQVVQAKAAYPNVPVIAIINPNSGPGSSQDANYVQGIKNLQAAGVIVLGYVDTAYGGDSVSSVEANVNLYHSWYGVDGVMFDDMTNQPGYENYYSTLGSYVHSLGMRTTMGNPGTSVPTSFIGTLDILCIYESTGYPSVSFIAYAGYSPSNFAVVALSVPLSNTFMTGASSLVGWVYTTDAGGSNPYDVLPSYFTSEVAELSLIDGSSGSTTSPTTTASSSTTSTKTTSSSTPALGTSTLSVSSVGLSGSPIAGLWTTWNQGSTTLSTGYTPDTFTGTTGANYWVTVADYSNYVFCHWQDGGTNSTRAVSLTGSASLTAYYSTTGACPSAPITFPVTIDSQLLDGLTFSGMYVTVTSGVSTVASGYTPLGFTATLGDTYAVQADNYGGYILDHWNTGSTSSTASIAPSSSTTLVAYYRSPVTLKVAADSTAGTTITDAEVSVAVGPTTVASGSAPLSATVTSGVTYQVSATAPAGWVFAHWQDGSTNPTIAVTPTQATTLTAYFAKQTPTVYVTVESVSLSGSVFTGMWLQVTSNGKIVATGYTTLTFTAKVGVTYTITMSNWRNYVFAHWAWGNTDPSLTVSPQQSATLVAYYYT